MKFYYPSKLNENPPETRLAIIDAYLNCISNNFNHC